MAVAIEKADDAANSLGNGADSKPPHWRVKMGWDGSRIGVSMRWQEPAAQAQAPSAQAAAGLSDPLEGAFMAALLRPLDAPFQGARAGATGTAQAADARRVAFVEALTTAPDHERVAAVRKLLTYDLDGLAKALGDALVARSSHGGGS